MSENMELFSENQLNEKPLDVSPEIGSDVFGRPYVLDTSPISGKEIKMAISDDDLKNYEKYNCQICGNMEGGCAHCGGGFRMVKKSE